MANIRVIWQTKDTREIKTTKYNNVLYIDHTSVSDDKKPLTVFYLKQDKEQTDCESATFYDDEILQIVVF